MTVQKFMNISVNLNYRMECFYHSAVFVTYSAEPLGKEAKKLYLNTCYVPNLIGCIQNTFLYLKYIAFEKYKYENIYNSIVTVTSICLFTNPT